ncbi:MAG: hypothetical protein ABSD59_14535 [Terracidiphilus sp.]|jgi:hypothetical protein
MIRKALAARLYFRACCFVLYFAVAAASFNGYYNKWHFAETGASGEDDRFHFEMMVDGTAYRPYVYRQLLPDTANWLDRVVPHDAKTWLFNHDGIGTEAQQGAISDSPTVESTDYFFRYLVLYVATFLFALLAVYAMYMVCRTLEMPTPAALLAPAIVILMIPYFESEGGFFYDYPELAFSALAFWIALRFDWWWIVPVAILGTWNKESFLLFVLTLYPLLRRRGSRLGSWTGIAVLCFAGGAVHYWIRARFAHNAGGDMELHWRDQLNFFLHPWNALFSPETTYGVYGLKAFMLIPVALLVYAAWRAWPHLPRAIQRHGLIAATINIPLYLLTCWPGEWRNLSLLYIISLIVLGSCLGEWMSRSKAASVPLSS